MADYIDTTDDNGGVHLNSGIPNRAFQLAATAIGGSSAEGAGRIWYAALTAAAGRTSTSRLRGRHGRRRRARTPTRSARPGDRSASRSAPDRRAGRAVPTAGRRAAGAGARVPAASPGCAPTASSTSTATTRGSPEVADLVDRVDLRAVGRRRPAPGPLRLRLRPLRRLARPCPEQPTSPLDLRAVSPTLLSSARLAGGSQRQRAVQRRATCSVRAREDGEVGVGLVDEQLELGAAEDDARRRRRPRARRSGRRRRAGRSVEHLAVHQLVVDHPVEQLVVLARGHVHLEAVARRSGR